MSEQSTDYMEFYSLVMDLVDEGPKPDEHTLTYDFLAAMAAWLHGCMIQKVESTIFVIILKAAFHGGIYFCLSGRARCTSSLAATSGVNARNRALI